MSELGRVMMESTRKSLPHCLSCQQPKNFIRVNCNGPLTNMFSCFSAPKGLEDTSKYPELFAALLTSGMWSYDDLKKLAGLNFLRVFKEVEKVRYERSIALSRVLYWSK